MKRHRQLLEELARWKAEGLVLPLWWRDDDAVSPTPALDRLIALATRAGAPLYLAVIPRHATAALADTVRQAGEVFALVHGWAHENHAPPGAKKAEFGAHRPAAAMTQEALAGRELLNNLFGPSLLPVFVPPWNRISGDLPALLPAGGYRALSRFGPRATPQAAPALAEINVHLDPVDWHGSRSAIPADRMAAQLAADLVLRRTGRTDATEPYGLLTHHLVHDRDIWSFTEEFIAVLADSGVAHWVRPFSAL